MSQNNVNVLKSVLEGSGITTTRARQLLGEAGGSVETAVGIYFSSQHGNAAASSRASSPAEQLGAILGPDVPHGQLSALLREAHNDVQGAVNIFYQRQGAPGTAPAVGADPAPEADPIDVEEFDAAQPSVQETAGAAAGGPGQAAPPGTEPRRRRTGGRRGRRTAAGASRAGAGAGAGPGSSVGPGAAQPVLPNGDRMWQPPQRGPLGALARAIAQGSAGARRPRPARRSAGRAPRWQAEDVLAVSGSSDSEDWSPSEEEVEVAAEDMDIEAQLARRMEMIDPEGEDDGRIAQHERWRLEQGQDLMIPGPSHPMESGPSQSESSEDDSDTDPAVHLYHQRLRRQPVFPIQKLLQRTGVDVEADRLPFRDMRNREGRLFAANAADVPALLPAAEALKFPVQLGSLTYPLAFIKAMDRKRAAQLHEHKEGPFPIMEPESVWAPFKVQAKKDRKTLDFECALTEDIHRVNIAALMAQCDTSRMGEDLYIEYEAKINLFMAMPEKKPKKAKSKVKASPAIEEEEPKEEIHASLTVSIQLLEGAITAVTLKSLEKDYTGRPAYSALPYLEQPHSCVEMVLNDGEGLTLGPDSDALLNFCDMPMPAQTAAQPGPSTPDAEDKGKALAGTDDEEGRKGSKKSNIDRLLTAGALSRTAPTARAPGSLQTTPRRFQLQGLQWMLDREQKGYALERGHLHLHPAWLQLRTADGQLIYVSLTAPYRITADFVTAPAGGTCGGFLCDEMGLGKTLETLMLVLASQPPKGWAVHDLKKVQRPAAASTAAEPLPIKSTLIVMPANLLQQWQDELALHVKQGSLKWGVYHGQDTSAGVQYDVGDVMTQGGRRSKRPRTTTDASNPLASPVTPLHCSQPNGSTVPLHHCDIVFMTYEALRKELSFQSRSLLLQFGFWRVVLDEAQLVAQSSSVAAVMVSALWRRHAWVVTGTPITSRVDEIQGLLEFLAYEPFYDNKNWSSLVLRKGETGLERLLPLCSLLKGVMLRRTKDDVGGELDLPECVSEDRWLQLSSVERTIYNRTFAALETSVRQSGLLRQKNRNNMEAAARRFKTLGGKLLRQFTELRQQCCHPQIVRRDMWLGKSRLSMRQILTRLILKAFNEYDIAVRAELTARTLQAAVSCDPADAGDSMEPVLRSIELATNMTNNTDLNALLALRLEGGHLPQADLGGPHPFRGSAPGPSSEAAPMAAPEEESVPVFPAANGNLHGKASLKRTADAAGLDVPQPPTESGSASLPSTGTAAGGPSLERSMEASESRGQPAEQTAPAGTGSIIAEPDAASERAQQSSAGGAVDVAVGNIAQRLRRNASRSKSPGSEAPEPNQAAAASGAQQDLRAAEQPADSSAAVASAAAAAPEPVKGYDSGNGQEHAGPSNLAASAAASLAEGACVAPPESSGQPSAEEKGKQKAAEGPKTPEDEIEAEARRAAKDRLHSWMRLRLEALLLLETILSEAEGRYAASGSSSTAQHHSLAAVQEDLRQVRNASESLRELLSEDAEGKKKVLALPTLAAPNMRFSRRQRGMEINQDLAAEQELVMQEAHTAQHRQTNQMLKTYAVMSQRVRPRKAAEKGVAAAEAVVRERWGALQHLNNQLQSLPENPAADGVQDEATAAALDAVMAEAGRDPAEPSGSGSGAAMEEFAQEESARTCPICLDEASRQTITVCGHHFCSDCIHEAIQGRPECPICRAPLKPGDLFDAATAEEEENQRLLNENIGNYGAKVTALLVELEEMRRADPGAKAVVFSAWGRLLKLVGGALAANGLAHVSLAGAQPDARAAALHRFLTDPDCVVILIVLSTGGGAAGLTLTAAQAVFLMEPAINPGLEAQAAARIHRLGQTKRTKVVRLLAEGTVEAAVLKMQERKLATKSAEEPETAILGQSEVDASTLVNIMNDHPPLPK